VAYTLLELYNVALSAAGTRSLLSDPSDGSRESELCDLHYPTIRDQVLRAAPWGVAKAFARLVVAKERDFSLTWDSTDPGPGWRFAYAMPSDILMPRFIHTFERFEVGRYGVNNAILSSTENAILAYTAKDPPINLWDADLFIAVASGVAARIARPLSGKGSLEKKAIDQANEAISRARMQNANQSEMQFETLPDWLTARGISAPPLPSRYIYPSGPFLVGADV
jgi:hypothetical protein